MAVQSIYQDSVWVGAEVLAEIISRLYLSRSQKTLVHNRISLIACMTLNGICGFAKHGACTSQTALKFTTKSISG